jgi:hypothetical protein
VCREKIPGAKRDALQPLLGMPPLFAVHPHDSATHDSAKSVILFLMFEKTPSERHQNVISLQWLPFATRHPVLRSLGEGGWQLVTQFSAPFPPYFCAKIK